MKTVFLHIGTHKTGSTSLQYFCDRNRDRLAQHGTLYPHTGRIDSAKEGHHLLARSVRRKPGFTDETCWSELLLEVNHSAAQNVIISSEDFDGASDETVECVRRYLSDFDVRVLVYLRNEVDFLCSAYRQLIKSHRRQYESFSNFVNNNITKCDYVTLLRRWAAAFGAQNVIAKAFDRVKVNPGIYDDFLGTVGLSPGAFHGCYPDPRNVSPSDSIAAQLLLLKKIEWRWMRGRYGVTILRRLQRSIRRRNRKGAFAAAILAKVAPPGLFSSHDLEQLRQRLKTVNLNLCRDWLEPQDAVYFVNKNEPVLTVHGPSSPETTLVG